jgi:hypothetical protein
MLHKILKIVAIVLSLGGVIFLARIIAAGDEAIETGEKAGLVDPIAFVAYIILGLVLAFVVVFVIKNLFTNTAGLKNTLIGVGAFAAVIIISYVMAGGDELKYRLEDGFATDSQSQMVGAGLTAFYILIVVAALAMIFSGVKKVISK